jgi:hypothetical protein
MESQEQTYADIDVRNIAHNILVVIQNRQGRNGFVVYDLQGHGQGLVAAALVGVARR